MMNASSRSDRGNPRPPESNRGSERHFKRLLTKAVILFSVIVGYLLLLTPQHVDAKVTTIGMNLTSVNYWTAQNPFVDRFKTSSPWQATGINGPVTEAIPTDANGNPTGFPAGTKDMSALFAVDPVANPGIDRYVFTWTGDAKFRFVGVNIISQSDHKIVFEPIQSDNSWVHLVIDSLNTNNPPKDLHVVRQDQMDLFKAGEIFNPDFIEKASNWSALRFMDWGRTNASEAVTWSNRATLDSATYSDASPSGVPIEIMVKLANKTNTDMWYNVPTNADDDFVRNALSYIRDNLKPGLKVQIEYTNENWNWAFPVATQAAAKANQLWGKDLNGDGKIQGAGEEVEGGFERYYGYRSAQIAAISQQVFGSQADARVENILATQTVFRGIENYIFEGVKAANVGSVADLFESYAITTYFGGGGFEVPNASDQATILGWARSGETGMAAAFRELAVGGTLSGKFSLADLIPIYQYQAQVAAKNGMKLVAYEGGVSIASGGFPEAAQPEVNAFYRRLLDDPRMAALYDKMVADFSANGGTELMAFADVGLLSKFGAWGMLDSVDQTGSQRWDALVRASGAAKAALAAGKPIASLGQNIVGSLLGGEALTGGAGDDTIVGNIGSDTIDGGVGADLMKGGLGNDRYTVDNVGDIVVEGASQGNDQVFASISYTLTDNVEQLTLTGTAAIDGTGNGLANQIFGNDAANKLYGMGGADAISGNGGNDLLDGGDGNDVLEGGAGNDTMIGGAGNDTLISKGGADLMRGGTGDDTYYVDDAAAVIEELPGEGIDTVRASFNYTLGANLERLYLSGNATMGQGNELDNVITFTAKGRGAFLFGLDGNDTLTGSDGADVLDGGTGNDRLVGGAGNDVLIGGPGQDVLEGGSGADRFLFRPGDLGSTLATADTITRFMRSEGDKIDLSAFDAVIGGTDDAFRFVGSADFSRVAGELRVVATGNQIYHVQADLNGDGISDLSLIVNSPNGALTASDFVL